MRRLQPCPPAPKLERDLLNYDVLKVAVRAHLDPRTVIKRIRGGYVRPSTAVIIDEALRAEGLTA